jgi:hypothetical protein
VHRIVNTTFGDANLDGIFDAADLVFAFQRGGYESDEPAGWAEGDWNGDGLFTSADIVLAFQDGGYVREAMKLSVRRR